MRTPCKFCALKDECKTKGNPTHEKSCGSRVCPECGYEGNEDHVCLPILKKKNTELKIHIEKIEAFLEDQDLWDALEDWIYGL